MKRFVLLTAMLSLTMTCFAQFPDRDTLGRSDKFRILVDKVISPPNKWKFTPAMMQEIKDAGFNVVSPRIGGHDLAVCREQTKMAYDAGLYYMAWMRGTLTAKQDVKMVWEDGAEQNLCSPNSDEFWEWTTDLVLGHARISAEIPTFIGSFLDYENYAPNSRGNCYGLSYDLKILAEFGKSIGRAIPELPPAERHPWLVKNKLDGQFRTFQINSWRERCRRLREQVDAINPKFQFIVYPAPGTLFMLEAVCHEWGTEQAPLILADAYTYGRPSEFMDEAPSLLANRKMLLDNMASIRPMGVPHLYSGGIDPVVKGADPEFCGKNASMISEVTDGYWIFYEGPSYTKEDHGVYFEWFARANAEIARGVYDLQHVLRSEPENLGDTKVNRKTDKPQLGVYGMKKLQSEDIAKAGVFEVHNVTGMSVEYLQQLDVVLLQNFNLPLPADSEISRNLRAYVEGGGALLLGHDTAWFMESMFPEIAVRDFPKNKVEAIRHVVDTPLVVSEAHPAVGSVAVGTSFPTEFRDHMIFKPGPSGRVVVRNAFGDPVYVLGQVGKGKVVFSGCYYGYRNPLSGHEKEVFASTLNWLAAKP
ncbi:MAG: hypothetical protein GX937_14780 [Lentisphaerae bacterium]|jgi:hypothetical protein|nr:hypothetical protein [Lentisphaerota bacterium]